MAVNRIFWMWSLLTLLVACAGSYLAVIPGGFALWNLFRNNEVETVAGLLRLL